MSVVDSAVERVADSPVVSKDDLPLLLVLPGLFVFLAFMLFPVLYLVYLSFTNAEPAKLFAGEGVVAVLTFGDALFVGLANYATSSRTASSGTRWA